VNYPFLFTKKEIQNGDPRFTVTMMFDKKTDITILRKAANDALIAEFTADKKLWPKGLTSPFHDGDTEPTKDGVDEFKGIIYVDAWTKNPPLILDRRKQEILDKNEIYSGCYARASLNAFAYNRPEKKGVSFQLRGIQKLEDGEPFFKNLCNANIDEFDDLEELDDLGSPF
jgi:hypothetical protein